MQEEDFNRSKVISAALKNAASANGLRDFKILSVPVGSELPAELKDYVVSFNSFADGLLNNEPVNIERKFVLIYTAMVVVPRCVAPLKRSFVEDSIESSWVPEITHFLSNMSFAFKEFNSEGNVWAVIRQEHNFRFLRNQTWTTEALIATMLEGGFDLPTPAAE